MPKEYSRSLRVGELMHRELARLVHDVVRDPRVGMVTIADVEVSRDLSLAKVYFTVLGDDADIRACQAGLNNAAGFLRREVGRHMEVRVTPELRFVYDDTQRKGERIDALIDQGLAKDHALREEDDR